MNKRIGIWQAVMRTALCVGIAGLVCASVSGLARAGESPLNDTIVVWAHDGFTQDTKTPLRDEMLKLAMTSPVVSPENIENITIAYLAPRLKANAPATIDPRVISHAYIRRSGSRLGSATILRINFTPWAQYVDGQRILIGALAVHLSKNGRCIPSDESEFQPVDTFIIADDDEQTQHSLEAAIGRLLERYSRGITNKF